MACSCYVCRYLGSRRLFYHEALADSVAVYEMSPTTTPGRGPTVPSIDTQHPDEKPQSFAINDFPLTPPQSANEYRRPSLAQSLLSESSHSGPSSVAGYSQPSTPVHGMPLTQRWLTYPNMHSSVLTGMGDGLSAEPLSHGLLGMTMSPQACSSAAPGNFSAYPSATTDAQMSAFGIHDSPMQDNLAYNHRPALSASDPQGLRTTLFQSSQDLGHDSTQHVPTYAYPLQPPVLPYAGSAYGPGMSIVQQRPNVVVPSQLSPYDEEVTMADYHNLTHQPQPPNALANSFDSASSWDFVGASSPVDAYMSQSDEADFVLIKRQPPATPSSSTLTERHLPFGHHRRSGNSKRSTRRGNKSQGRNKDWLKKQIGNIELCCQGTPFRMVSDGKWESEDPTKEAKPHKCGFPDENGDLCDSSFARSEHLKRHMGKHTSERAFSCPIPECKGKRIGRSDNANQHFRTHLMPPKNGKRNKHCDWETLQQLVRDRWPEKHAVKLLVNLQRFVDGPLRHEMQKARNEGRLPVE